MRPFASVFRAVSAVASISVARCATLLSSLLFRKFNRLLASVNLLLAICTEAKVSSRFSSLGRRAIARLTFLAARSGRFIASCACAISE